jgi:hypothetical protein
MGFESSEEGSAMHNCGSQNYAKVALEWEEELLGMGP